MPDHANRSDTALAHAVALLSIAVALAGWHVTSRALPPDVFPGPLEVAQTLSGLMVDRGFWFDLGISAIRVVTAVVLATVLGTIIGMLPRYFPSLRAVVEDAAIPFFTSFPGIAWAILGTVWFGLTPFAILIIQVLIIIPFCMVNVAEGAKDIAIEEVEMGRSFGRRPWKILWMIELPMLSPYIVASVRISYGICWKISLIAELFGARSGLGHLMQNAQEMGRVDMVLAICLVIVALVAAGSRFVIGPLARRLDITARQAGARQPGPHPDAPALPT